MSLEFRSYCDMAIFVFLRQVCWKTAYQEPQEEKEIDNLIYHR